MRPHRSVSDEEAHRPPRGKRASWSGNSLTLIKKILFVLKKVLDRSQTLLIEAEINHCTY
ncbi:hypothetical protein FBF83_18595 [Pseudalkalibacillus hwajinpoensis]|uniref:Uncharacterized protein n=1 Tax=Guptibacillus hwajinpoensis TaxID=208199 RepID=A0A4U1MA55_9BACL|nr:hypothetical protein FBF83_18595 [Pseudalkalibacillus hwajinpoensis]